ncbi:TetR/AcrR family transcriptional regulator [Actinoplanes sichuanensis]|uniref:TetR/AcrR family transcriptional regulator n=1 Tax=Actinoplanes sichuanensis TaxID=512349 RepID=A0ABW4A316_9ACTN|nr:TetR/AcrR family transcriptional regulator [Actinoplanes sichuanensis]BEL05548.1 TetR/AcrR family transcriptional regulator [Actinoplanes sichuanensis]
MSAASAGGRPRDPDVDRRIAQAALDVFGDTGWAGFAMETVARRAAISKPTLYLRWNSKEVLLTEALTANLGVIAAVDTGTLHGDLVELATQMIRRYTGPAGRAALRLSLEGPSIPGVAEHDRRLRRSQIGAARDIVRRGIARGELPADTSATLLMETLLGGALMHAVGTDPEKRDTLHETAARHARRLVDFLLNAVAAPAVVATADLRPVAAPLFMPPT